jgi:alpha-D-ribose 1-methylphosphonate 5-triphosphate synthase subunit PhnI
MPLAPMSDAPDGSGDSYPICERDGWIREDSTHLLLDPVLLVIAACELLECALIASAEQEKLAVGQDVLDELIEKSRPRADDLVVVEPSEPADDVAADRLQAPVKLDEDVLLALEVVVQRGLGDVEALGDLAQGRLVVTLFVEQRQRDLQNALPRVAGPWKLRSVFRHAPTLLDGRQVRR